MSQEINARPFRVSGCSGRIRSLRQTRNQLSPQPDALIEAGTGSLQRLLILTPSSRILSSSNGAHRRLNAERLVLPLCRSRVQKGTPVSLGSNQNGCLNSFDVSAAEGSRAFSPQHWTAIHFKTDRFNIQISELAHSFSLINRNTVTPRHQAPSPNSRPLLTACHPLVSSCGK